MNPQHQTAQDLILAPRVNEACVVSEETGRGFMYHRGVVTQLLKPQMVRLAAPLQSTLYIYRIITALTHFEFYLQNIMFRSIDHISCMHAKKLTWRIL